jgi:hypothetical protein
MNANWLANDNVLIEAIKAKAIHNAINQRGVLLGLPPHSWRNGSVASEIVSLRAASNRYRAASRATTHPELKVRLATRALELAMEAEALSRIKAPVPSPGPATRRLPV